MGDQDHCLGEGSRHTCPVSKQSDSYIFPTRFNSDKRNHLTMINWTRKYAWRRRSRWKRGSRKRLRFPRKRRTVSSITPFNVIYQIVPRLMRHKYEICYSKHCLPPLPTAIHLITVAIDYWRGIRPKYAGESLDKKALLTKDPDSVSSADEPNILTLFFSLWTTPIASFEALSVLIDYCTTL